MRQDVECLDEMARSLNPSHKTDLERLGMETGITRLGSQIGNMFYCTNYMNALHSDHDASPETITLSGGMLQPCMQTEKSGCKPGEFDFVMLKWGIRFQTHTNAVW